MILMTTLFCRIIVLKSIRPPVYNSKSPEIHGRNANYVRFGSVYKIKLTLLKNQTKTKQKNPKPLKPKSKHNDLLL